jgi:phosphomethylpyrimidine synthase
MASIGKSSSTEGVVLAALSTGSLPGSEKIYLGGSRPSIQVPVRAIAQSPTRVLHADGREESVSNPTIYVYDTSGPYTDPNAKIDVRKGLEPLRLEWIRARGDVEEPSGFDSEYTRSRSADESLKAIRFPSVRKPLRARPGQRVTQMHYARRGEITPEMEFIALRENLCRDRYQEELRRQHPGNSWGVPFPSPSPPSSCAMKWREDGRLFRGNQSPGTGTDDYRAQLSDEDQRQHRQFRPEQFPSRKKLEKMVWAIRWGRTP